MNPTPGNAAAASERLPRPSEKKIRVALIGCGANAAINHLPVLAASPSIETAVLVDLALARAEELAHKYGVPVVSEDYRQIEGLADAAIVALPNHLHAPVTIDLLRRGVHVLVEKPMALNTRECDAMIEAARSSGATLAVGLEFRFCPDCEFIKRFLAAGLLGRITSFDMRMGLLFSWPVSTDYLFRREQAGGGVLMDFGVHVLDLLLWWLGDYNNLTYADDARGGLESNCTLRLEFGGGAAGTVEISRTRNLRNSCILTGERGRLEIELWTADPAIRLEIGGDGAVLTGRVAGDGAASDDYHELERQIEDFAGAIRTRRPPLVDGHEGRRTIELIEACYRGRRPLPHPWSF